MHIALVSTSLNESSHSRQLLRDVERALQATGTDVSFFDAQTLPHTLCDGRPLEDYPAPFAILHAQLAQADAIVLGVPIYNQAVGAPCWNLVNIVGSAMSDKPVAVVSASGSPRSHLAIGPLIVSLVLGFRVRFFPSTIQVSGGEPNGTDLDERTVAFASSFQQFVASLAESSVVG